MLALVRKSAPATLACLVLCPVAYAKMPIEELFRNVEFSDIGLSPDGKTLAAITRTSQAPEARNLVVLDIASRKAQVITGYESEDIRSFDWISSDRVLFKVDRDFDEPGKYGEYVGTYSLRKDGKKGRVCHEPFMRQSKGLMNTTGAIGGTRESIRLLDTLPFEEDYVLAEKSDRRFMFPEVYRMNVQNGRLTRVTTNHHKISRWFPDNRGQVRAALDLYDPERRRYRLLYRVSDDEWQSLVEFGDSELAVLGYTADNRHLIVASRVGQQRMALYRLDPESKEFGEPILEDAVYDVFAWSVNNVPHLVQTDDGRIAYYQYMADKPVTVFFDADWKNRQAALDMALPGTVNTIVDWNNEETLFLVRAWSDRVEAVYYLYDEENAKLSYLVSPRSWLDPQAMSPMTPVSYTARDGLEMHGYLTLPADKPARNLPLVVHPHGGPYGIRDEWGFDQDVQYLASRGYAVLQVNYRGSGGYGRDFLTTAYRKWGLQMQDDITDGVLWAVDQGYVDPDRVCIYGASYGGYATMMGLVKTPELYRCGINYVGVVDLPMLIEYLHRDFHVADRQEWLRSWSAMALGDPGKDRDRFYQTSPINHVEKIQAPLLVIHGQLDGRVDIEQFRSLLGQLDKHDKNYQSMVKRYEGHGFYAERNKIELYERIDTFLAEHLR